MTKAICAVDGCGKDSRARGWCVAHYARWKRNGAPEAGLIYGDDLARFWSKVDRRADDECWPWLGTIDEDGYGRFRLRHGHEGAHRTSYRLLVGPIPTGLVIDHVYDRGCRRRDCVNPAHLEPVTVRENTVRAEPSRRTHCPQGHPYDAENEARHGTLQKRTCLVCSRERNRRRRGSAARPTAAVA